MKKNKLKAHKSSMPKPNALPLQQQLLLARTPKDPRPTVKHKQRSSSLQCYENLRHPHNNPLAQVSPYPASPRPESLAQQPAVTQMMRAILLDWIFQVSEEFRLSRCTTHRGIAMVDKYLNRKPISKEKLQLLGITCLFIVHKLQQTQMLGLTNFSEVTDRGFDSAQIVEMEKEVIKTLKWRLCANTFYDIVLDIVLPAWVSFCAGTDMSVSHQRQELLGGLMGCQLDYLMLAQDINLFSKNRLALALLSFNLLKSRQPMLNQHPKKDMLLYLERESEMCDSEKLALIQIFQLFMEDVFDIKEGMTAIKQEIGFVQQMIQKVPGGVHLRSIEQYAVDEQNRTGISIGETESRNSRGLQVYRRQNLELFRSQIQ